MREAHVQVTVRRPEPGAAVLQISGDVTAAAEAPLAAAHEEATDAGAHLLVLDFHGLDYMNSSGIGMLVTLLVRARRHQQQLAAVGLSDHYRQIFELTRLDEAIALHSDEADALAAVRAG
jgi:anti-sigma B factor antagonist